MEINFGDVVAVVELRVPGLVRYHVRRAYSVPRERPDARPAPATRTYRRTDRPTNGVEMDLKADQEVDVRTRWQDEMGNPVDAPADATTVWETDNPAVLDVIDNGDGTATLGAVGGLGTANVKLTATGAGREIVGEDVINVVAGDAERVALEFGEPRERDDDNAPADPPVI
jgi:hypothetical protein